MGQLEGAGREVAVPQEGVATAEVDEVLGLADRVLVVREGAVVAEAPAGELDESKVLDLVMEGAPA